MARGKVGSRGMTLRPHRRARIGFGTALSYFLGSIGNKLYYLGATVERRTRNGFRRVRHDTRNLLAAVFRFIAIIFTFIGKVFTSTWNDLTMPFRKIGKSFKSLRVIMKGTQDKGRQYQRERVRQFFYYGWLGNKHLVGRFFDFLLPFVSFVVCISVILSFAGLNFALEVGFKGQIVGYVQNEDVYDAARRLIQSKMVETDDIGSLWSDNALLGVTVVGPEQLFDLNMIADNLLSVSGSGYQTATGIYIGGTFYGATKAPDLMQEAIESLEAPFAEFARDSGDDEYIVKFARSVDFIYGVFATDNIEPFDSLLAKVTDPEHKPEIVYHAKPGESVLEIALKNGISLARLYELNPDVSFSFTEPTDLVVAVDEALLRVKIVKHEYLEEGIAYNTVIIRSDNFTTNQSFVKITGRQGRRLVVLEHEYDITGREIGSVRISEEILDQPIDAEIIVGTKGTGQGNGVGTGFMIWPTGGGYRVSRGFTPGGHKGIDIAAATGTDIYAADGGKVVTALYTNVGYGVYIIVDHMNGIQTLYAHCSALLVEVGDYVSQGQLIGLMGSTGNSTGPHLHFEVRVGGVQEDPAPWIGWVPGT